LKKWPSCPFKENDGVIFGSEVYNLISISHVG